MGKRSGRKPALATQAPMTIPEGADQRCSVDFAADAVSDRRGFRVFRAIDDFTRECLAVVGDAVTEERVPRELDHIAQQCGFSLLVAFDNSTEFASNVMLQWQQDQRVGWHYIGPGKACRTAWWRASSGASC